MRQGFGGQHKRAKRARDWDDRPPPEPPLHGPWEHLPLVALAAIVLGLIAGANLTSIDRRAHDRVLAAAGFAPDGRPADLR